MDTVCRKGRGCLRFAVCCGVILELELRVVALGVHCAWKALTRWSSLESLIDSWCLF